MRKILTVLATAIIPCGVMAAVPESVIEVQRDGDDSYRLVITTHRSSNPKAAQQEMAPKMAELCGTKHVVYGKFEYSMTSKLGAPADAPKFLVFKQNISCSITAVVAPQEAPVAANASMQASAEQVKRVQEQTALYFSAKDQGRYTEAYALMSAAQKAVTPFARFKERSEAFNARAGAARSRSVKKITWYRNPPQVAPGLYAAVDFTSQFANLELHCGLAAWHQQPDGRFLLVREEENFVTSVDAKKMKPWDLDQVRAQYGCK